MKNKILKKTASLVTAVSLVLGLSANIMGVNAADTYGKDYTLENVMTDYLYFVEGDANLYSHTVGSVVTGGALQSNTWSQDGGIAPSYAENLKEWNIASGNAYTSVTRKIYYGTTDKQIADWQKHQFEQNPEFIDVDVAFDSIRAESKQTAASAEKVFTEADVKNEPQWTYNLSANPVRILEINTKDASSFRIPYDLYRTLTLILINTDDVDYFEDNECTISVDGYDADTYADDTPNLTFGYINSTGNGSVGVKFSFNNPIGDSVGTLSNMSSQIQNGQCSYGGMKLVWNFPDVTEFKTDYPGGHIVAPNADVELTGGRFEGSIIAKNVTAYGEGHYFSYNKVDPTAEFVPGDSEATPKPTSAPIVEPTVEPTAEPTAEPTVEPTQAPEVLLPKGQTKDYTDFKYAYIFGYEPYNSKDGDVILQMAPEEKMTREQICAMLVRVDDQYNDKIGKVNRYLEEGIFNDNAYEGRWSYNALASVAATNAFAGKTDLDPAGHVSRGEVARIVAFMMGLKDIDENIGFADVAGDENETYINIVATAGYMKGYEDDSFKPASAITRAEFCSVLNNIIGRTLENGYKLETADGTPVTAETYHFSDLSESAWYYETMLYATSAFDNKRVDLVTRAANIRNKLDGYDSQYEY